MAAESPFGASFGDPRKYMGQSPLAQIGQGIKQGLTAYALKESGFTDYLNKLNKKPVQGAVAPTLGLPTAVQPPQQGVAPMTPQALPEPSEQGVVVTPIPDAPPRDIGEQILDGKWDGFQAAPAGPVSFQNPTDFNPLAPDVGNQFAMSGNDYQQVPGYGKLQKIASQLFGMG